MGIRLGGLRSKALGMIAPLALVLFAVSGHLIWERLQLYTHMRELQQLTRLSTEVGQLVHELQKERGMSSGFVGAKGQAFQQELPQQRRLADDRARSFENMAAQVPSSDKALRHELDVALQGLKDLVAMRASVDSLSVTGAQVVGAYTRAIEVLLAVSRRIPVIADDAAVAQSATAYSTFLFAKENAGIERAVLTNTFAADAFGAGMYERFVQTSTAYQVNLDLFVANAAAQTRGFFEEQMRAPVVGEVAQMRQTARERAASGGFGVRPDVWFKAATARIDLMKQVENRAADDLLAVSSQRMNASTTEAIVYVAASVLSAAAAFGLVVYLMGGVLGSIRSAMTMARDIAGGDLSRKVRVSSNDEAGALVLALGSMQDQLLATVGGIREIAGAVSKAAGEIAAGNGDVSQRTESQAASLEETAASMQELASTVAQNTTHAQAANTAAGEAARAAQASGEVIADVVRTMEEIKAGSRKMDEIVALIDSVAFQTNILALNAAVEAARAGEQGRGFAVVAGEVRNLAQRSAAAAKEIKTLIDSSVRKVESGASQVASAGSTINGLVGSVARVEQIVREITAAGIQQSNGILQVNQAISEMDGSTQRNAALVEQATAAAQSLREQAARLSEAVAYFRTEAAPSSFGAEAFPVRAAGAGRALPTGRPLLAGAA